MNQGIYDMINCDTPIDALLGLRMMIQMNLDPKEYLKHVDRSSNRYHEYSLQYSYVFYGGGGGYLDYYNREFDLGDDYSSPYKLQGYVKEHDNFYEVAMLNGYYISY